LHGPLENCTMAHWLRNTDVANYF